MDQDYSYLDQDYSDLDQDYSDLDQGYSDDLDQDYSAKKHLKSNQFSHCCCITLRNEYSIPAPLRTPPTSLSIYTTPCHISIIP